MGSDLTKFYQTSMGIYLIFYLLALFLIEYVVNKRIVNPVLDLTQRMRKPKDMNSVTN